MNEITPTIKVIDLKKKFGSFTAVDSINFEVHRGEIFGFLGPNGSGKTTTIRMTLGLLQPTSGSIEVLGLNVQDEAKIIRPRVGYMSQRFSLYNDLSVIQNLKFYGTAYGLRDSLLNERIHIALSMAGLDGRENSKTKDLSGGWRQRLALSAAILHRPAVLFLDEPTAGVDPISRRAFWDLLYSLAAENITVFVTTHYMDEAEHCHRLAFIQHGKIIAYGSPAEIKHNIMKGQVLEISSPNAVKTVQVLRSIQAAGIIPIEEVELYGSIVHLIAENVDLHLVSISNQLLEANIVPDSISIIEPSLEDVFISCMRTA
jgi:ABC-2 type transport system ATP-binding protein